MRFTHRTNVDPMNPRILSRTTKLLATGLALSLLASGLWAGPVEAGRFAGITEPFVDVALSLPVAGIMAVAHLKEGDFVQANDVILELDERLEVLEVERRRIVMENSKADWESTKVVFEKTSAISRDVLLKKEADYKVASTEYNIALEELKRRKLLAPSAGVITELKLHPGEACTAFQPIARLVDTRKCYFECNIDAGLSLNLAVGKKVQLLIDSGGTAIAVEATIVFVSPVVDSASGLQRIRAVFDNGEGRVRPGLAGKLVLS